MRASMQALLAVSLLGSALLASSSARADEAPGPPRPREMALENGMQVPPGYRVEERTRRGPVTAGAIVFGTSYGLALATATISVAGGYRGENFFIPVLGPFLQMGRGGLDLATFIVATDGIAQGVGLTLLVYGLVAKKPFLVRNDLVVAPVVTGSWTGLAATGRF